MNSIVLSPSLVRHRLSGIARPVSLVVVDPTHPVANGGRDHSAARHTDGVSKAGEAITERVLQIIDEGRRTATYKLALLLALMDACAAHVDTDGRAPTTLHTRVIARHVLTTYLPQARLYLGGSGDPLQLRQITSGKSAVLGAVIRLHREAEAAALRPTTLIEQQLPAEFERCLDEVERTFARYPIRLLQVVGGKDRPFLYEIDWTATVSLARLHDEGGGLLRFRSGAGDHLIRLAPLIRPLVQLHWTRMISQINGLDTEGERIHSHLFGAERQAVPRELRSGLHELQQGRCFYCRERLSERTEVDHFIPWSRWPNDSIENLVLADRCNTHKRDHLPARTHVANWRQRLTEHHDRLEQVATASRWESNLGRSLALTRSCYAHLPGITPLWRSRNDFVDEDPAAITALLNGVT